MANYNETARTNYFRVKDPDAFQKKFSHSCGEMRTKEVDGETLFGFLFHEGVPSALYDVDSGQYEEMSDFMEEIQAELPENEVCVMMAIGFEKMSYLAGYACAVTSEKYISLDLNEIYDKAAEELGVDKKHIVRAEY